MLWEDRDQAHALILHCHQRTLQRPSSLAKIFRNPKDKQDWKVYDGNRILKVMLVKILVVDDLKGKNFTKC